MEERIRLISLNAHLEEIEQMCAFNELDIKIEAEMLEEKECYLCLMSFNIFYKERLFSFGNMIYEIKEIWMDDALAKQYTDKIHFYMMEILICLLKQNIAPSSFEKNLS